MSPTSYQAAPPRIFIVTEQQYGVKLCALKLDSAALKLMQYLRAIELNRHHIRVSRSGLMESQKQPESLPQQHL